MWTGLADGWDPAIPMGCSRRMWLALQVALGLLSTGDHLPSVENLVPVLVNHRSIVLLGDDDRNT